MRYLFCLLFVAPVHGADWFLLQTGPTTFERIVDFSVLNRGTNVVVRIEDPNVPPTPEPDPAPDPVPGDFAAFVAQQARAVDEPKISAILAASYELTWAKAMRENGTPYGTAITGAKAFDQTILTQSQKRAAWEAALTKIYAEMAKQPKTAATLSQAAAGFQAATGGEQINTKIIECILCFIEAMSTEESTTPIPEGQSRGSGSPTYEKPSVTGSHAAPATFTRPVRSVVVRRSNQSKPSKR